MEDTSSDKLDYYLASLDELGETLINEDQTRKVAKSVLRLTLGTVMASIGAILLYNSKKETLVALANHRTKNFDEISTMMQPITR